MTTPSPPATTLRAPTTELGGDRPTPGMRPLIKWPGGKGRELSRLLPHFPTRVRRYHEPFLGGGAVFFALPSVTGARVNDANPSLIQFYQCVASRDPALVKRLTGLAEDWDGLARVAEGLADALDERLGSFRDRPVPVGDVGDALAGLRSPVLKRAPGLDAQIAASVADKLRRVTRLEVRHEVRFDRAKMREHLETAVRAAYYTRIRDGAIPSSPAAATAEFFFVREYCYGAMFRFNAAGKFNIPYGGIAYNRKRFRNKVEYVLSDVVRDRLSGTVITCQDFEACLEAARADMTPDDFVFLDPPYDSEFSAYDQKAFGLADHERLARVLSELPCRWLLVIKETPDVERIYGPLTRGPSAARRTHFDKAYTYNVRGRNDRRTVHLIFTNVPAY